MVIRTINGAYRVIRALNGSPKIRAYLCLRQTDTGEENVLLMGAKEQELSKNMLLYFFNLYQSRRICSFKECFTKDGVIWIVFPYYEGMPLFDKLKEAQPTEERFAMGKELIGQIFTQNLPLYLQYEALHPSNIVVHKMGKIQVNFLLFEPQMMEQELFSHVQRRLADIFFILWKEELKENMSKELTMFVQKLSDGEFLDGTSLYRSYRALDEMLQDEYAEGKLKRKGYLALAWENIKKRFKFLFHILYGILVVGLLALLVYVCRKEEIAPAERNVFGNIGTLEIRDDTPALYSLPNTEKYDVEETEENIWDIK